MFCESTGEDEALYHRLDVVSLVVSALPLVAFLYSLIVWSAYSFYKEIHWTNARYLKTILIRLVLVVSSTVASCGVVALCGACGERLSDKSLTCLVASILVLTVVCAWASYKLIMSTRQQEVVGVEKIPFYGSKFLEGKFMVVTGANNGIGFETTRQLAAQGATVAMLCRNPKRANKAMDDIIELQAKLHAENPKLYPTPSISKDQLIFVPIDLTEFDSIRRATTAIGKILDERKSSFVDSLVCNAGLMMGTQSTTKDGLETMMQANHLGHFLLMKLMLEKNMLKTTTTGSNDEPSRVCILTSSTYLFAASTSGFDFVDPYCSTGQREYTLFGQYSMTKLANLLISRELARRYNTGGSSETETALAVFAVHPGIVRTNVTSNMNWYYRLGNDAFAWIVAAIQKTPAEGAYSTVYTVAAPLSEIPFWKKGSYVANCKEQLANDYVEGPKGSLDSTRLWEWSEEELEAKADASEKKEQ